MAGVGRTLVTVGLLLLLFVAYQLWGTGVLTARAQNDLEDEFARLKSDFATTTSTSTTSTDAPTTTTTSAPSTTTTEAAPTVGAPIPSGLPRIGAGDPLGRIRIPKIGVDWVFVQGTSRADLKKGPGHYPDTPIPGQVGNAAIAGHRTTYGAPFYRLDELAAGDEIEIETLTGSYTYRVRELLVVAPTAVEVVRNTPNAQLTLTTCNPRFSARQRLVAVADLVEEVSDRPLRPGRIDAIDQPPRLAVDDGLEEGLQGDPAGRGITVAWGVAVAAVGLAWWWVFRRWRLPATWWRARCRSSRC
jgi:sortase A